MRKKFVRTLTLLVIAACAGSVAACSEASRLRSACLGGDVAQCIALGDMYATGTRVPRDLGRAAEMYQQACDRGAADTCNVLGEIYEKGTDLEGGPQRAEQMFRQACNGGSAPGCLNLGLVLAGHDDKKSAASLFERACTAGWTPACHHLAAAYEQGAGVLVDLPRAITLYDEACANKYVDACVAVGNLFLAGERLERDGARAARYYGSAVKHLTDSCEAGHEASCQERDRLRTRMTLLGVPMV